MYFDGEDNSTIPYLPEEKDEEGEEENEEEDNEEEEEEDWRIRGPYIPDDDEEEEEDEEAWRMGASPPGRNPSSF